MDSNPSNKSGVKKLSATMQAAFNYAVANGNRILRFPGGYWAREGWQPHELSFGTTTIDALVFRGVAQYTDFQEGRSGRFPVEITICLCEKPPTLIANECPIHG
jgi:hypothetical protein